MRPINADIFNNFKWIENSNKSEDYHIGFADGIAFMIKQINNAPTINITVNEAPWYEIARVEEAKEVLCECGNCSDWQLHYYNYIPKYCPNCGCKMSPTVIKKEFDNGNERMDTESD